MVSSSNRRIINVYMMMMMMMMLKFWITVGKCTVSAMDARDHASGQPPQTCTKHTPFKTHRLIICLVVFVIYPSGRCDL